MRYLVAKGKNELHTSISLPRDVRFTFLVQAVDDRYGTFISVDLARDFIGADESVLVCKGDDFLRDEVGGNEIKKFIEF